MFKPVYMKHFKLYELVSPQVINLLGTNAWSLFNEDLLKDTDKLVDDLKRDLGCKGVTINDWKWEGRFTQSGFREANSDVGAPSSQHKRGNALDLKFRGITVSQAYHYLIRYQDRYPSITRVENIEHTPTWLHIDGKDTGKAELYIFNP